MSEKQQINPFPVRLEPELSQWVKARAKAGDRSVNAELIRIVRQAKDTAEQQRPEATNP